LPTPQKPGQDNGTASFVLLSRGGLLGEGAKYFPIPFQTFISDVTNMAQLDSSHDLISNLTKSKIESGPNFADKKAKELTGKDWANKVCSYYGAQCHFM
jgi:hypothetical protein